VKDLAILIGWQAKRVREAFGHGESLGVHIEYAEQAERLGTAHAIGLAKGHVDGPFLALNGDIVLTAKTVKGLLERHRKASGPVLAVAESANPSQFGVVDVRDGMVVGIEEKPKQPKSNLINAGVYVFDADVFDLIERTPKSPRGEYEITDTLRLLIKDRDVHAYAMEEEWIDVGNGTRVRAGADIRGPAFIGEDCDIGPNCLIRPSTSIGNRCKVGNGCEVKNSIVMDDTHVPHLNYVGDSILGERCNLGAGTKVANLRLDERNVRVTVKGTEVDTGLRKLGVEWVRDGEAAGGIGGLRERGVGLRHPKRGVDPDGGPNGGPNCG
jgi:bifunctional UDP-N-acetylglucosamine pyrophosphorylase/glucosamine-1-phosphate N-acetyltransferase